MARYDTDVDLTDPAHRNGSQAQAVELVGSGVRVLDVGCATGSLARALRGRGCRVWGVDRDAAAAERARPHLEQLVIADLDVAPLTDHFERGSFDVIVFGDVLEHLVDPTRVLREAVELLADDGRVVCSIPNIAHGSVRLSLLEGRWTYTETGLLDSTHLRFFDRAGVQKLHAEVGLTVDLLRGVVLDPLATEVEVDADALPASVIAWVRAQEDSFVYQFLTSARRARPGDSAALPELEPVVAFDEVRLVDEHALRHGEELRAEAENAELRHTIMTQRDHVIGLEATAATARTRTKAAERNVKNLQRRVQRMEKNLKQQRAKLKSLRTANRRLTGRARRIQQEKARLDVELGELRASRSWRVGRALTSPARALRRGR
ncbi:class I SAM-dependent methyltransferase [Nocardioides sp. YIM 152315]|uniref:class I SAM-dependent methyltransferase n=1 Tax=Nocardioides sp. YIM 152315 TaxID=3031760 RepID=UPI0023D98247|nr:class I SAM-dependent methyltransferase [Nocardioides sp. YIM 152315]MDF1606177.1 class I SAM-dependent methyltransferase [Nocardioides sp. YIM 152315]